MCILEGHSKAIDQTELELCIEIRTFVALVWGILIHQQHPSPERQARIEARLHWFRDREEHSRNVM